jgi:hypothetical protein
MHTSPSFILGGDDDGQIDAQQRHPCQAALSCLCGRTVCTLNGIGRFVVDAVAHRDYPVVQALIFLTAFSFVIVNLLVDLTYVWFDPRIATASPGHQHRAHP